MTRPRYRASNCNLIRDGVEFAASHTKSVVKAARGCMSVVVRANGKLRAYRRGSIPEKDVPNFLGTYNGHTPLEDITEDLQHRLAELAA